MFLQAIVTISFAILSDRTKMRSPFILASHAMLVLGFGIQISNAHFGVKYFGTFLVVAGGYAAYPAITAWCAPSLIVMDWSFTSAGCG